MKSQWHQSRHPGCSGGGGADTRRVVELVTRHADARKRCSGMWAAMKSQWHQSRRPRCSGGGGADTHRVVELVTRHADTRGVVLCGRR